MGNDWPRIKYCNLISTLCWSWSIYRSYHSATWVHRVICINGKLQSFPCYSWHSHYYKVHEITCIPAGPFILFRIFINLHCIRIYVITSQTLIMVCERNCLSLDIMELPRRCSIWINPYINILLPFLGLSLYINSCFFLKKNQKQTTVLIEKQTWSKVTKQTSAKQRRLRKKNKKACTSKPTAAL